MTSFAKGKFAFGFCDICGFRYPLSQLKPDTVKGRPVNVLACPSCSDEDHPQLQLGMRSIYDPQALRNPRPDTGLSASREVVVELKAYAFNNFYEPPVYNLGSEIGNTVATFYTGNLDVYIDTTTIVQVSNLGYAVPMFSIGDVDLLTGIADTVPVTGVEAVISEGGAYVIVGGAALTLATGVGGTFSLGEAEFNLGPNVEVTSVVAVFSLGDVSISIAGTSGVLIVSAVNPSNVLTSVSSGLALTR
jgi:hypothetical protein